MSTAVAEHRSSREAHEDRCSHCGAELAEDQEWCLECGAARTLLHRPPDWRAALAIVGGVAAVAVLVFVLVLWNVSSSGGSGNTSAASAAGKSSTVASSNLPARGALPGWPVGLGGWTVGVISARNRSAADKRARRIAADGVQVGVLNSSLHPALRPGRWIVFSGRYPTKSQAAAAATQLISLGHAHAHPLLVGRPA